MRPRRTLVVAALPEECAAVRERMTFERRESWTDAAFRAVGGGALRADLGRLGDVPIALVMTGDGGPRAGRCADAILRWLSVKGMIVIGIAGGLDPSLEPGTLLLARAVVDPGGPSRSATLPAGLAASIGARVGVVLTAPDLVTGPEWKADLWSQNPHKPAVVDLESAPLVDSALAAGLPWLVLRAVSDTASETIPEYLNDCRDDLGGVRRGAVALHAVRHPSSAPALMTLKRRTTMCALGLAAALEVMLSEMECNQ